MVLVPPRCSGQDGSTLVVYFVPKNEIASCNVPVPHELFRHFTAFHSGLVDDQQLSTYMCHNRDMMATRMRRRVGHASEQKLLLKRNITRVFLDDTWKHIILLGYDNQGNPSTSSSESPLRNYSATRVQSRLSS